MNFRNRSGTVLQHLAEAVLGPFSVSVLTTVGLVDDGKVAAGVDAARKMMREVLFFARAERIRIADIEDQFYPAFRLVYMLPARTAGTGRSHFQLFEDFGPLHGEVFKIVGYKGVGMYRIAPLFLNIAPAFAPG